MVTKRVKHTIIFVGQLLNFLFSACSSNFKNSNKCPYHTEYSSDLETHLHPFADGVILICLECLRKYVFLNVLAFRIKN